MHFYLLGCRYNNHNKNKGNKNRPLEKKTGGKDLGHETRPCRIEHLAAGKALKMKVKNALQRKYWHEQKGFVVVFEELKQKIIAKAHKVKRYESRIQQYRQNRLFYINQGRLYTDLERESTECQIT